MLFQVAPRRPILGSFLGSVGFWEPGRPGSDTQVATASSPRFVCFFTCDAASPGKRYSVLNLNLVACLALANGTLEQVMQRRFESATEVELTVDMGLRFQPGE